MCLEVLSADVELAGNDPFGQVKSGSLVIRGKTQKGVIRCLVDDGWGYDFGLFKPEAEASEIFRYFTADSARFREYLLMPPGWGDDEDYLEATLHIRGELSLDGKPRQDFQQFTKKRF